MNGELEEFDEKEKERRRNDQISYRQRQNNSNLFLFVGIIFEIIISLAFVFLFFILSILICARVESVSPDSVSVLYNILLIVSFIGGLALGFFVYRRLGRFVIRKFKLHEKLRDDVLNQFKTRKEYKEFYEKKKSR